MPLNNNHSPHMKKDLKLFYLDVCIILHICLFQYQDDINELNEIARHRPRSTLVLGIAQENRQIRELQQENKELCLSLEEHQSALELIMQKYREQVMKLIQSNRFEKTVNTKQEEKNQVLWTILVVVVHVVTLGLGGS